MDTSLCTCPVTGRPDRSTPSRYLINILLGLVIRRYRETCNLTQENVAERAGCHASYLSAIENGRADLSIKTFDRLCKALSVSANWLYLEAELLEKHYLDSGLARSDDREWANPLTAQYWHKEYLQQEARCPGPGVPVDRSYGML
jgi:transcriptional regulator with XRE-family HTH domain